MGLHYHHDPQTNEHRTAAAILVGLLLGILVTLTLVTTWHDAAAIETTYTSNAHTYRITPAIDGSPYIYQDGVRMYLTGTPPYGGE